MIIPKEITQSVFCVNFHPGPPEHPGSCSANWALYYQDKTFGVTAHLMNGLVDNGLIFRVRRFPIKPETTLMEVLKRADQEVLKLFKEIGAHSSGKVIQNMLLKDNDKVKFIGIMKKR